MTIEVHICNADGKKTAIHVAACLETALARIFEPVAYIERLKRKEFLSAKEVEELYDISEGSLRTMRNRNAGPRYYQAEKNASVRYAHQDIREYLKNIWRGGGNALSS